MSETQSRALGAHSKFYSGIRNGLWERKHEEKMGPGVWLFGWLISRQTNQNGSRGDVLGGKLLTWRWISQQSGWPERTLQRWGKTLEREGYIEIVPHQHSFTVAVLNAKKFAPEQTGLFPPPPKLANPATNGGVKSGGRGVKSGDRGVKSGDREGAYQDIKSKEKSKEKSNVLSARFDEFWRTYPRKVGRKPAQEAWKKVRPEEVDAILRSVEQWKQTDQWRENLRFIPHPTTFLNQRRWEDQIPAPQAARRKGRLYGEELTEHNLRVAGFLDRKPDPATSGPVRGVLPAANHAGPDKPVA